LIELPGRHKTSFAAYLKLYKKPSGLKIFKERLRESKPRRAFKISQELSAHGFMTPTTLVCGENANHDIYSGILVIEKLAFVDLSHLPELFSPSYSPQRLIFKKTLATTLGQEMGKLHNLGYVHGDLVVTNILVDPENPSTIVFIDHDRSTCVPALLREHFQIRNLIQVNRHVIKGVNHCDRLRAFLTYANTRGWSSAHTQKVMRRIATRTLRRRLQRAQK
jgi:serine/threonine-protein kinase RIO1